MDFTYLKTCESITEDDFCSALVSKLQTEQFLRHIEDISKPGTGVGKVLFFFARVALQNKMLDGSSEYVYEDLALQVSLSTRNNTLFEIRLMNNVGDVYELIYKITVWCEFDELLRAVNDKANIVPFVCTAARENYLLLEATAESRRNSMPPAEFKDADARVKELLEAGMLSPGRFIPTIPAPEEEDPTEVLAGAVVDGRDSYETSKDKTLSDKLYEAIKKGQPISSVFSAEEHRPHKEIEVPDELTHATVSGAFPSPDKKTDQEQGKKVIARIPLVKADARKVETKVPTKHNSDTDDEEAILPIVYGKRDK